MESTDSNTPKVIVLTGASSGIGEATTVSGRQTRLDEAN
ncbi:NADP-dependent 3-hydroxy acid dehydrogenase YdfG [Paraburkholderia atlantica]